MQLELLQVDIFAWAFVVWFTNEASFMVVKALIPLAERLEGYNRVSFRLLQVYTTMQTAVSTLSAGVCMFTTGGLLASYGWWLLVPTVDMMCAVMVNPANLVNMGLCVIGVGVISALWSLVYDSAVDARLALLALVAGVIISEIGLIYLDYLTFFA